MILTTSQLLSNAFPFDYICCHVGVFQELCTVIFT